MIFLDRHTQKHHNGVKYFLQLNFTDLCTLMYNSSTTSRNTFFFLKGIEKYLVK